MAASEPRQLPLLDAAAATVPAAPPTVEVVRSARRRRTVSAGRHGDRIIVRVPARMPAAEVDRWVATLVERVLAAERRRRPSDAQLAARAAELSARYLDGRARPTSVSWSDRQQHRWGSCTPADGTIRLSRRLAGMPRYVQDAVLLHELAHLLESGHGPRFKALVGRYPDLDRADAFLAGWSAAVAAGAAGVAGTDGSAGSEDSDGAVGSAGSEDSGGAAGDPPALDRG